MGEKSQLRTRKDDGEAIVTMGVDAEANPALSHLFLFLVILRLPSAFFYKPVYI